MQRWGAFGLIAVLIGCAAVVRPPVTPPTPLPSTTTTTSPPVTIEPHPGDDRHCVNPRPGPIAKMEVKVHTVGPNWRTIDATPLVGKLVLADTGGVECKRDSEYCASVGFTDGRGFCSPRAENTLDRGECDQFITGGGIVWSWQDADPKSGPPRLVTCFDNLGFSYTCRQAPEGVQMHEEGWMLLVRPSMKGKARACPRILSSCPGETDDLWNGCGILVIQ